MATFKPFTVVSAPFPYVERPITKRRPCLVVGEPGGTGLVWVVMITSVKNAGWAGDVDIKKLNLAGLKAKSVVRTAKVATVEADVLNIVGVLDDKAAKSVAAQLAKHWKV